MDKTIRTIVDKFKETDSVNDREISGRPRLAVMRLTRKKASKSLDRQIATRSLDPSPSGFYLWGYLKDNVYQHDPSTIEEFLAA
jgi:hypothetical protein